MGIEITRDTLADGRVLEFIRAETEASPGSGHAVLSGEELAGSLDRTLADRPGQGDVWLFGYGSLVWNPAFRFAERREAMLAGWQRRFCLWLRIGRGSIEQPGLMLALDWGDSCRGIAFRIPAAQAREELSLVWVREMASGAYVPRWVGLETADGPVSAIAFVADPTHDLYAGAVPDDRAAALIAAASGRLGTCADYLLDTADHLSVIGMPDPHLDDLAARVRAIRAGGRAGA